MNIDDIIENAQLKGRVIALEAEVKCLEAVIRAHERLDCLQVKDIKAENARLKAECQARQAENSVLAVECDSLKAEVERLEKEVWRMKVFKGIDEDTTATLKDALNTVPEWAKVLETEAENARLKAEVDRLKERNQFLEQIDSYLQSANLNAEEQRSLELEAQVERLTKAGDAMADECSNFQGAWPLIKDWLAAKGVQS